MEMTINKNFNIANVVISMVGLDFGYNIDPSMWYISYCFLLYAEFYLWKKLLENQQKLTLKVDIPGFFKA